jgi:hypothetical protein
LRDIDRTSLVVLGGSILHSFVILFVYLRLVSKNVLILTSSLIDYKTRLTWFGNSFWYKNTNIFSLLITNSKIFYLSSL